ncbi:MAG TPA: transketolase C-terminal domain-containing protein [Candidatus Saccharimonadales bacterium]|nr:transketolase C-terminal domain-containing protein [Candidatus Saccharimonadales bacterium]
MSNVVTMHLATDIGSKDIKGEPIRAGFGRGLLTAGREDDQIVGLCADLVESTKMNEFADVFPDRYIEIGVAEQNLVTVASGLAAMGKKPFVSSYSAFCPGRDWEQIRTTICLNDRPVRVVGSHAGVSVGPDGATHQMLEDIPLMRSLPNMVVVAPGDSIEAEKATLALAKLDKPSYIRLAREATPIFTTHSTPFELGRAYVLREGDDISLIGTGSMTYQCLVAAKILAEKGINAEVVHVPTIKPLDRETIVTSAKKTRCAVTAEEGQLAGGFGGAIAELLGEECPVPLQRVGIRDRFGESGQPEQLLEAFGLTGADIAKVASHLHHTKKGES